MSASGPNHYVSPSEYVFHFYQARNGYQPIDFPVDPHLLAPFSTPYLQWHSGLKVRDALLACTDEKSLGSVTELAHCFLKRLSKSQGVTCVEIGEPTAPYHDSQDVERYLTFFASFRTCNGRRVAVTLDTLKDRDAIEATLERVKIHPDFDMVADDVAIIGMADIAEGERSAAWNIWLAKLSRDPVEYC